MDNTNLGQDYFHKIINTVGDPIFVKDAHSRLTLVNDAFCSIFGLTREEIIGKTLAEHVPLNEREHFLRIDKQVLEEGKEISVEETLSIRDNETKTIITKKTRYIDENGNKYLVGIIRDITDLKKTEQKLTRMIERFNLATRAAQIGVFDFDITKGVAIWDARMFELYGIDGSDAANIESALDFWGKSSLPDDFKRVSKEIEDAVLGIKDFDTSFRIKMKDGSIKYIKAIADVFKDETGKVVRLVGVNYDITAQHRQEQLLARAERLESIGILAGGIAHDFNNLLAGLFGYIELAQRQCASKKLDQLSETLEKSLTMFNRTKDLSNQLLTFSKGGSPQIKSQSLTPVIRRSAEFSLSGSNIELVLNLEQDLWNVDIDENQIGQAIDNIVINAKQAMNSGGKISISAKNIDITNSVNGLNKGRYVCVVIQDNGTGIPEDTLAHIFDPFFTTKPQGSGIGLATVYSIIKKHLGLIEVQSEIGLGTSFTIWLPASTGVQEAKKIKLNNNRTFHDHVLIVDDETPLLEILKSNLESLGCTVACAVNGEEALNLFKKGYESQQPFKLAILDLTIPGGEGGKEIVHKLRKVDPGVIVLASSGYADDPIMASPRQYGFNDSITKPYTLNDLVEVLSHHLFYP